MRFGFLIICLFYSVGSFASIDAKIYDEDSDEGVVFYAENNEKYPVSFKVDFKLKNIKLSNRKGVVFVVSASTKKQKLCKLPVLKKERSFSYGYTYETLRGDVKKVTYDTNYLYDLPFKGSHLVEQGYNGTYSHKNTNALDFDLDVNTAVFAIRDGVVVEVVEHHYKNCTKKGCEKFNNYVIIYHSDGTLATYVHIKNKGVVVNVGDEVVKGNLIGYSGNTGFSSGPHLHIEVFKESFEKESSLKTKFKTSKYSQGVYLEEGKLYTSYP